MAMKIPGFVPHELLLKALGISVIGGLVAYVLSMLMAPLMADVAFSAIYYIILLTAIVYLAKKATVDNMSWFQVFVLLLAMAGIGSVITWIQPSAAQFILGAGDATLLGFAHTILYIEIAEIIMKMVK